MPPQSKPPRVPSSTFAELINAIVVTPDAPNGLLSEWSSKYNVTPLKVTTTNKVMTNKPTKKQLLRAKKYQRRLS